MSEQQAEYGRRSGEARRFRIMERNESILDMIYDGHNQAEVARHFGVSRSTVCRIAAADPHKDLRSLIMDLRKWTREIEDDLQRYDEMGWH